MSLRRVLALAATSCCLSLAANAAAAAGAVESTTLPIRVTYVDGVAQTTAEQVLSAAEETWLRQVDDMGFTPPTYVDENGDRTSGLLIHLDPNADYDRAVPEGDNPDTPWTDCTIHVQIVTLSPASYLDLLVPHETNHAFEMADDCGESDFAWEQTTMAVTTLLNPSEKIFTGYALPAFQGAPNEGLPCTFFYSTQLRYYHYGASLFQIFLEDRYGAYDGKLLSQFWKAARQDGTVTSVGMMGPTMTVSNDPDLFAAMSTVLAPVTLQDAFVEFAQWRYFVGANDDGSHFREGASWSGGEVAVAATHAFDELPIVDADIPVDVNELGSAYVEVNVAGLSAGHGLGVTFQGGTDTAWNVDALLIPMVGPAEVRKLNVAADGSLQENLTDLEQFDRVVLAVSNLGDGVYAGEMPECASGGSFSYGLEDLDLSIPPTIESVDPGELTVGTDDYLWITGTGFADGTTVQVSGSGVEVVGVELIDETTLGANVSLDAAAAAGPRDLIVTHPNGKQATLTGGLMLFDASVDVGTGGSGGGAGQDPGAADSGGDEGCACKASGRSTSGPWAWLAAGALGLGLVRRRRASRNRKGAGSRKLT